MDTNVPQQPTSSYISKPGRFSPKSLFIQILLLLAVIVVFILGLAYFNLLSISKITNLFSTKNTATKAVKPRTASPTPTIFSYDSKTAEIMLTQYLKDNLKPTFLPTKIEVKQSLIASGKQEGTLYEFGSNWNINNDAFTANFHYNQESNTPSDMEVTIIINSKEATATAALAKTLAKSYLNNPGISIPPQCGLDALSNGNLSFCEYFSSDNSGKNGFGIVTQVDQSNNITNLFFSCRISKESVYYSQRDSCLLFRSKK